MVDNYTLPYDFGGGTVPVYTYPVPQLQGGTAVMGGTGYLQNPSGGAPIPLSPSGAPYGGTWNIIPAGSNLTNLFPPDSPWQPTPFTPVPQPNEPPYPDPNQPSGSSQPSGGSPGGFAAGGSYTGGTSPTIYGSTTGGTPIGQQPGTGFYSPVNYNPGPGANYFFQGNTQDYTGIAPQPSAPPVNNAPQAPRPDQTGADGQIYTWDGTKYILKTTTTTPPSPNTGTPSTAVSTPAQTADRTQILTNINNLALPPAGGFPSSNYTPFGPHQRPQAPGFANLPGPAIPTPSGGSAPNHLTFPGPGGQQREYGGDLSRPQQGAQVMPQQPIKGQAEIYVPGFGNVPVNLGAAVGAPSANPLAQYGRNQVVAEGLGPGMGDQYFGDRGWHRPPPPQLAPGQTPGAAPAPAGSDTAPPPIPPFFVPPTKDQVSEPPAENQMPMEPRGKILTPQEAAKVPEAPQLPPNVSAQTLSEEDTAKLDAYQQRQYARNSERKWLDGQLARNLRAIDSLDLPPEGLKLQTEINNDMAGLEGINRQMAERTEKMRQTGIADIAMSDDEISDLAAAETNRQWQRQHGTESLNLLFAKPGTHHGYPWYFRQDPNTGRMRPLTAGENAQRNADLGEYQKNHAYHLAHITQSAAGLFKANSEAMKRDADQLEQIIGRKQQLLGEIVKNDQAMKKNLRDNITKEIEAKVNSLKAEGDTDYKTLLQNLKLAKMEGDEANRDAKLTMKEYDEGLKRIDTQRKLDKDKFSQGQAIEKGKREERGLELREAEGKRAERRLQFQQALAGEKNARDKLLADTRIHVMLEKTGFAREAQQLRRLQNLQNEARKDRKELEQEEADKMRAFGLAFQIGKGLWGEVRQTISAMHRGGIATGKLGLDASKTAIDEAAAVEKIAAAKGISVRDLKDILDIFKD